MTQAEDNEVLAAVGTSFARVFSSAQPLSSDVVVEYVATPDGYGTDPNLVTPARTWPTRLSEYQKRQIAALCDVLLPASTKFPGAVEVGCVSFFEDWIGAPYATQQADTLKVIAGLVRIDQIAHQRFGDDFLLLSLPQKHEVVEQLFLNGGDDAIFFVRFRAMMLGAYFTTEVGMRVLGYRGNVPLSRAPRLSKTVLRAIDEVLAKLGL